MFKSEKSNQSSTSSHKKSSFSGPRPPRYKKRSNSDSSQGESPFRERSSRDDAPFRKRSSHGDNPFKERPSRGDSPFRERSSRDDAPFREKPSQDNAPFRKRSSHGDSPFRERSSQNGAPFRERSSRGDAPFRERSSQDDTPFRKRSSYGDAPFRKKSHGMRPRPQKGGRPFIKFNPSDFIKKVEECTVAPTYTPKHQFADFAIEHALKKNIARRGYTAPTPIQDQAIPLLLEQKDLIGSANTGTGKTAAFLIPLIHNVLTKKTNHVLIVAPTRELATQIQDEFRLFSENLSIASALCIGGLKIGFQIARLAKNPKFVIGTPGRLKDLEQTGSLDLSKFDAIVLDEVDTMLDMGFINDMKYIISRLPEKRHSLFFSATMSEQTKSIMHGFLHNPVTISVKTRQSAENVNQDIIKVEGISNKVEVLHDLLIKPEFKKAIVFVRTKRLADKLARELRDRGFQLATIHGDKTQAQRKKALDRFKANLVNTLLATDVVARGIDIDDVSHVINFDMPQSYEDYIHRIGRTGRANKVGQALTFVD